MSGLSTGRLRAHRHLSGALSALTSALVLALPLVAAGAEEVSRWQGESSFESRLDAQGRLQTRAVNQRFLMATLGEGEGAVDLVLRERVEVRKDFGALGPPVGEVRLEVYAREDQGRGPLRSFSAAGESGELLPGGLYRIRRAGCCGAADRDAYFDLASGRELLRASAPLLSLSAVGVSGRRLAALHAGDSVEPPAEHDTDARVCAVLTWSDGAGRTQRLVLRGAAPIRCTAAGLAVAREGRRLPGSAPTLPGGSGWAERADLALVADIALGAPGFERGEVWVPIEGDTLVPERARLDPALGLNIGP